MSSSVIQNVICGSVKYKQFTDNFTNVARKMKEDTFRENIELLFETEG